MRRTVPMDRLVCGDVGYGKTEIAVRAAFKAVQDGKQVAVLVPTTLLVTQHLSTFTERMSGFPVVLKGLSRFQTDKEAREVIAGLADGTVDIVVGTHRLLNPDIRIKDLGLIIVDEEQRFGVEHKEQMKRLRTSVDVLSMSATPIPRTLEMAITGIREMSTITTPPEERHPVLTYVGAYEDRQVVAAIRRELLREGQVFYIHNRVNSIEKAAARIRELVPEARVATAHGQMGEHQLEQVMLDFWEKRFDVLVCTTIVESGLDVSNANTMIIERADTLGLSPAAPAARPGRPVARAGLRLLPLPGGEAAHRDRPRAAGDAGPALRPRRRHGDRDEGPRDPRRRQPARRRAVRPHRRRRLRPLRPAGRRGGPRVPRRRASPSSTRSASSCRSTPTCRTTTSPASGCGWRCTSGWPRSAPTRTSTCSTRRCSTGTASRRRRSPRCCWSRGSGPGPARPASARSRSRARTCGSRPVALPESRVVRLNRLYPKSIVKAQVDTILVPRPQTAVVGGQPIAGVALLEWARGVIDAVIDPPRARKPQTEESTS